MQGVGLGRLDAAEHGDEARRAHEGEHPLVLREIQRRLAGEAQRVAPAGLPLDEVREQLEHGLLVADEVVVHEVDRQHAGLHQPVELGEDLRGPFHAWVPAVELRDIAEVTRVGAPARELDAGEEVLAQAEQLVAGSREIRQRQPLTRLEAELRPRPLRVGVEVGDDSVGRVAQLTEVHDVGVGIVFGAARDRRPAEHDRFAVRVRPLDDPMDPGALHVHARDEQRVGPGQLIGARGPGVLVDEAHLPRLGQVGRDDQEPLRRHERAHAAPEQRIRALERAERAGVPRIDEEDTATMSG